MLSKVNYLIHTDSIKKNIIPILSDKQKNYVYAEEADVLNVALFGMTAKEWRDKHPDLIASGVPQKERLIILNQSAKDQVELRENNKNIKELEKLQNDVNNGNLLLNNNKLKLGEENVSK